MNIHTQTDKQHLSPICQSLLVIIAHPLNTVLYRTGWHCRLLLLQVIEATVCVKYFFSNAILIASVLSAMVSLLFQSKIHSQHSQAVFALSVLWSSSSDFIFPFFSLLTWPISVLKLWWSIRFSDTTTTTVIIKWCLLCIESAQQWPSVPISAQDNSTRGTQSMFDQ